MIDDPLDRFMLSLGFPTLDADVGNAMRDRYRTEVDRLCSIAFPAGCRVAIATEANVTPSSLYTLGRTPVDPKTLAWDYVILGPGERPPGGRQWTIYEDRGGLAVGRTA